MVGGAWDGRWGLLWWVGSRMVGGVWRWWVEPGVVGGVWRWWVEPGMVGGGWGGGRGLNSHLGTRCLPRDFEL